MLTQQPWAIILPWQSASRSSKFYPDLGNQAAQVWQQGTATWNLQVPGGFCRWCYHFSSSCYYLSYLQCRYLCWSHLILENPALAQLQLVNPELGINLLQVIRACVVHCGFYALKSPWEHSGMTTFFFLLHPVLLKMLFCNCLNFLTQEEEGMFSAESHLSGTCFKSPSRTQTWK